MGKEVATSGELFLGYTRHVHSFFNQGNQGALMKKKSTEILTQQRLHELLHYDKDTGIFTNKITRGPNALVGQQAGCIDIITGYRSIIVDSIKYRANRLAWFYVEGYWPEHDIDHKDRNRHNNRWMNLRHISRQCNIRNMKIKVNNTSGVTGVFWRKTNRKWASFITVSYKKLHLGTYENKLDAVSARWEGEKKYNFPSCNTISPSYLYLKKRNLI